MSDPRVCVIGAGNLATRRILPYIGSAGGQVAGVCDLDRERAARNARRFGGRVYTDVEAMLDAETPDGVLICIGPGEHAKFARQIVRRGVPVYVEKPPAATAAETLEIARAARHAGVLCMTAFKKRHNVAYGRAKEWLAGFKPGDYYALSMDYGASPYPNTSVERSLLLDFGIHAIDLMHYLFGDVSEVFAFSKGSNAYAVSLRFANGAVGSLNITDGRSFHVPTEEVEITVRGGNFMTVHNSSEWRISEQERPVEWREPSTFVSTGESGNETGHFAEIVDFLSAIREGRRTSRSDMYESYKSMALYEAIRHSAGTGERVRMFYETL